VRFFENRTQSNIVKRDCELMGLGKAFDLLFTFLRVDRFRENPGQLGIVNRANLLLLQFGFDSISKFSHMIKEIGWILAIFKDAKSNHFIQNR